MEEVFKEFKRSYKKGHLYRIYEVSNLGRIKRNGEIIEPINKGYPHIGGFYVHQLVAKLFIPNPENKPCIDHIDTNICNNRVDNLRWVTPAENLKNPISQERRIKALKNRKMPDDWSERVSKSKKQYYKDHPELIEKLSEAHKGYKHTEESKQKMSNIQKQIQNMSDIKHKKSERMKGINNPMYGKNIKDYMTEEAYENWKNNLKGRTAWNKDKKCEQFSGENNPMYGKGLRRWVNKDGIRHLIKKEDLDNYIKSGWKLGQN